MAEREEESVRWKCTNNFILIVLRSHSRCCRCVCVRQFLRSLIPMWHQSRPNNLKVKSGRALFVVAAAPPPPPSPDPFITYACIWTLCVHYVECGQCHGPVEHSSPSPPTRHIVPSELPRLCDTLHETSTVMVPSCVCLFVRYSCMRNAVKSENGKYRCRIGQLQAADAWPIPCNRRLSPLPRLNGVKAWRIDDSVWKYLAPDSLFKWTTVGVKGHPMFNLVFFFVILLPLLLFCIVRNSLEINAYG